MPITIEAILTPLGNVFSGVSVESTRPPTTSKPPYANNANTKNPNIPRGV